MMNFNEILVIEFLSFLTKLFYARIADQNNWALECYDALLADIFIRL